jgi:hypothetical protein
MAFFPAPMNLAVFTSVRINSELATGFRLNPNALRKLVPFKGFVAAFRTEAVATVRM